VRVALVIERFEPHGGGVEAVAWNVAGALAARGADVHVVARSGEPHPAVTLHGVRVPTFWQPLRVLAFSRAAARAAAAAAVDVVHSFSRTRHQDVFRAGGGSHADYLERSHGPVAARLRRLSPRHAVLLAVERAVFRDPRQIVQCNSAMVRDELARRHRIPAERLVVIPNGVDLARFHPRLRGQARAAVRAEATTGDGPVWLFAGSGFRRKGLDVALRALALSGDAGTLWVAGRDDPAPWRRRAAELGVAERTRFLGPRRDLERVYAAADALILPTRYDAFANVCLEALAAGLPVVTSGANGAAATVADAGFVVDDPEDAAGFAKALARLAEPAARAELAARARPNAERHGWDACADALLRLYARIRP
jgi:UDP-glucose:(heptosyl)LPS alpha-1,3-glucosyltransferase